MESERSMIVAEIERDVALNRAFVALASGAAAIATFGLLANSVAVIIGAMLVAPLMTPIVALALAIISGELALFRRAAITLTIGATLSVLLAALLAALVRLPMPGPEILLRSNANLLDLGVALAAGGIAGYARVRKSIATSVGGAAIAVALMPPLCVAGIGLSLRRGELAYGALLLFATNLTGITLACAIVFALCGFATEHARKRLLVAVAMVSLVAIPLAFSTAKLLERSRLEAVLRGGLLHDTQTFKRVELVNTSVDWLSKPIRVTLLVRAREPITPTQVGFLQTYAEGKLRRKLALVIEATRITAVQAPTPSP